MLGNIAQKDIERIADRWIRSYGSFSPTGMSKAQSVECWAHLAKHDDTVCRFLAVANDYDLDNAESWIQTKIAFQKRQVDASVDALFRRSFPERNKAGKAAWIMLIVAIAGFLAFNDESAHLDDVESQMARSVK